ncbi:MAG: zinc ribbon domain-containing protein [Candidatus Dadabacteria bacterium]|nr:zinc ribbon domain-containing protein [Candidatus Dadabacteria bacterium]
MPLFEFSCNRCDHKFESLVLDTDEDVCCPECGTDELNKLFSTFGLKTGSAQSDLSETINTESSCCSSVCGCGTKGWD